MTGRILIRAASRDGVTEVRALMSHPMETGQRRDSAGNLIPGHFITELTARHNDRVVLSVQMSGAVSTDPYFAFKFKGGEKGDRVTLSWVDNLGESQSEEALVT